MWAQQPKDIAAAPVPSPTLAVKKVFISSAGGEEVDPQTFGVPDMNPTRPNNQFYAALEESGKYETVSAPSDADLILETRFTHSLTLRPDVSHPTYAPVLKRKILDPKTGGSASQ